MACILLTCVITCRILLWFVDLSGYLTILCSLKTTTVFLQVLVDILDNYLQLRKEFWKSTQLIFAARYVQIENISILEKFDSILKNFIRIILLNLIVIFVTEHSTKRALSNLMFVPLEIWMLLSNLFWKS